MAGPSPYPKTPFRDGYTSPTRPTIPHTERPKVGLQPPEPRSFLQTIASETSSHEEERTERKRENGTRTETLKDGPLKALSSVILHPPEIRIPLPRYPRIRLCSFLFEPETDLAVPQEARSERHQEFGRVTWIMDKNVGRRT